MPKLLGPGAANGVEIKFGGLIVGRERGCDIVLRSKNVSRNHARLTIRDEIPRVEDLGSSNGTKVNGVLIKGITELHVGDSITFGDMTLQLVDELPTAVQSDPPPPSPALPVNPDPPEQAATAVPSESRRKSQSNRDERRSEPNDRKPSPRDEIESSAKTQLMRHTRSTFALEACLVLLGLILLVGFFTGRVAQRMGGIKLPGELSTRENLVAPVSIQALTSKTVDPPTHSETSKSARSSEPLDQGDGSVAKSTINGAGKVNQEATEASILDRAEGQGVAASSNAMSTVDSAKALRLMREVERAGVDLGDTEAVLKIANQKLGMTPDQTRRVVRFVKVLAERKALIEGGGLNFNLDSKSKTKSTASGSSSASVTPSNPTLAISTPPADGSQNVIKRRVNSNSQGVAGNQGNVHQSEANDGQAADLETEFTSNPSFIMSVNRGAGYYINIWGLMLILGLAFAWQQGVYWMGADCRRSGMENEIWPLVACIAGPVGTLCALCCPDLGFGTMLNCACLATPFLGYVAYRDERVPRENRVLQFLSWFESGNEKAPIQHRQQEELSNLSSLGFHRTMQGELRDIVALPQGLLVVCGPTGAGKSTTLRAAIAELDPQAAKIFTIEDSVEDRIDGVTQIKVDSKREQGYSSALQRALHKEAEVVLVGEILDGETAVAVCQAATTGHMLLSTVPANDSLAAIQSLIDLGVDPDSLGNALTAVLGQRLIRRLCIKCKEQYTPDAELLRRYRIPRDNESTFYRPPGNAVKCEACGGTGYCGRVGLFELLRVDETVRALIRDRASPSQIRSAARRRGMTTLREYGFRLAIRGVTSLDEVQEATRD